VNGARLLVVGPSWVGDMVMAQSLFRLLQARQAGLQIDVIAPPWSLPVIARMPEISTAIPLAVEHGELALTARWQLGHRLRASGYSKAIVLPRSMKAALVPWFASVPQRTGFRGEMRYGLINDMRALDRAVLDQTVKRFVALGLEKNESLPPIPYPQLRVSRDNQQRVMKKLEIDSGRPAIAMMPGAEYGPAKCWPLENFASLARMLGADGFDVWVLGSERDRAAGEEIAQGSAAINLCGRTGIADAIDLLAHCRQAVSNDSGLMHVAAAAGTAVVAVYGSSSPAYTPPLTEQREIHYLALECSPCFKRQCPLGHLRCLRDIQPSVVYQSMCG
jgi:heptosyltransferase-2